MGVGAHGDRGSGQSPKSLLLGFQHIDAERWWIPAGSAGNAMRPKMPVSASAGGIGCICGSFSLSNRRECRRPFHREHNESKSPSLKSERNRFSELPAHASLSILRISSTSARCSVLSGPRAPYWVRSARLQTDLAPLVRFRPLDLVGRPTIETVSTQTDQPNSFVFS